MDSSLLQVVDSEAIPDTQAKHRFYTDQDVENATRPKKSKKKQEYGHDMDNMGKLLACAEEEEEEEAEADDSNAFQSLSVASDVPLTASGQSRKRKKAARACNHCQTAHLTCDDGKLHW